MRRRNFLGFLGAVPAAALLEQSSLANMPNRNPVGAHSYPNGLLVKNQEQDETEPEKPQPLDSKMVQAFVGQSHGRFAGVKELCEKEPRLVHASWDWGNGDWETGLGAASHVGNRPIAEFLIEKGARVDVFAATMLGMKELVSAFLTAMPLCHQVAGPHGIPLLAHAVYGKMAAREVLLDLLEAGADVNGASYSGMTSLMAAVSVNDVEVLELLLKHDADPNQKNSAGETALDQARKKERTEMIGILEKLS